MWTVITNIVLKLNQASAAIWLGQMFMWIIAWYLVYQIWCQRWALLILWGDIIDVSIWVYSNRHHFIGHPEEACSPTRQLIELNVLDILSFISILLITAGAARGLYLLQKKFREINSQQGGSPYSSPAAGSESGDR